METVYSSSRRLKRQYPQGPQTPRILHLPRRLPARRKSSKTVCSNTAPLKERRGNLEASFDGERLFHESQASMPIVMLNSSCEDEREEEKWRVEAEMLRAECGLLRMEKEVAVKKMERKRAKIEKTLKSVIHTLLSGRERICEGDDASMVLEEEINYLVEKLQRLKGNPRIKNSETKSCGNFDKKASILRQRLEKFDAMCPKGIREMAEASLSFKTTDDVNESLGSDNGRNMENLRKKMEVLSKGILLDKMEKEYDAITSRANSAFASSACNSKVAELQQERTKFREEKACGHCTDIVRKIVEQVRAEAKQWSQMQQMLGQVRHEMEELEASRDSWQDRALDSDSQIQALHSTVQEWRQKALSSEAKVKDLQDEVSKLTRELNRLKSNFKSETKQHNSEMKTQKSASKAQSSSLQHSKEPQTDTILGILMRRLKENRYTNDDGFKPKVKSPHNEVRGGETQKLYPGEPSAPKRSPLQEIGNLSWRMKQKGKS